MKNKNFLYNAKGPIVFFFILISLPWVIQIKSLISTGKTEAAFELSIFAFVFLIFLFWMQKWFKKMLIQYQNNLNISIKKMKNYKGRNLK